MKRKGFPEWSNFQSEQISETNRTDFEKRKVKIKGNGFDFHFGEITGKRNAT